LRYRYRLVAAMLLVSVPLMIVLAVFLTNSASSSLTSSAQGNGVSVALADLAGNLETTAATAKDRY
jgi:methyl-accepting chemotaxis protein